MAETKPRYIDTHSHLGMLEHDAIENILERARNVGVRQMVTVSTNEASWPSNEKIASENEGIYFSLGLHPHDAIHWTQCAPKLTQHIEGVMDSDKFVAIGEFGLDYHYDFSPREIQLEVLESQLRLANRYSKPTILHCRDAFEDMFASLKKVGVGPRGGVMHCFTGNTEEALASVDLGMKISFSGILTFKNAEKIREAAKKLPLESLLIETDCPYLAPVPYRGKPNEPAYLPFVAQHLATALGKKIEEVAELTTKNATEFFKLG